MLILFGIASSKQYVLTIITFYVIILSDKRFNLAEKNMEMVLLTALGVGGATIIGALIGFLFKNSPIIYKNNISEILLKLPTPTW